MRVSFKGRAAASGGGPSLTTRRSFIVLTSLGAVSLYAQWAALGAAPLRFWQGDEAGGEMEPDGNAHGEHGAVSGSDADAFRKAVEKFVEENEQPDGSVFVDAPAADAVSGMAVDAHDMSAMPGMDHGPAAALPEAYLLALQWSFEPAWLKLRAGVSYRLRFMAVDTAHGASLQLGPGSQIIRLPKGQQVSRTITFVQPGIYLIYCTVYCGEGHHLMNGKLEIV